MGFEFGCPMLLIKFSLFLQGFVVLSAAQSFDSVSFVQQRPGSYCDASKSCCYPTTRKPPSDFGIHGLPPNDNEQSVCRISGLEQYQSTQYPVKIRKSVDNGLVVHSAAQSFDFFYFVQQWPGSYCATSKSCCYPTTGKPPSDFGIHGLWPNNNNRSYPSNCDPSNQFDRSKISDLVSKMQNKWANLACPSDSGTRFWEHEWQKHGTCSEPVLDQHAYFKTTLELKSKVDLLQALQSVGINPDGGSYSLNAIKESIRQATGFTPWVQCNRDTQGNWQLFQVYICVNASASGFIQCPVFPRGKSCASTIRFPAF